MSHKPPELRCPKCGHTYQYYPGGGQDDRPCPKCGQANRPQPDTVNPADTTRLHPAFHYNNWHNPSSIFPRSTQPSTSQNSPSLNPSDSGSRFAGSGHEAELLSSQRLPSLPPSEWGTPAPDFSMSSDAGDNAENRSNQGLSLSAEGRKALDESGLRGEARKKEYGRLFRLENKDAIKERDRKYWVENREVLNERQKQRWAYRWGQKTKAEREADNAHRRERRKNDPEVARERREPERGYYNSEAERQEARSRQRWEEVLIAGRREIRPRPENPRQEPRRRGRDPDSESPRPEPRRRREDRESPRPRSRR